MRIKVISPNKEINKIDFNKNFNVLANEISMEWSFEDAVLNPNTSIFVSKYSHCLQDLLYRHSVNALKLNIKSVFQSSRFRKIIVILHSFILLSCKK